MGMRGPVFVFLLSCMGFKNLRLKNKIRACSIDAKLHCMCNAHPTIMIGSGWTLPSNWAGSIHFGRRMRLISMML